MMIYAFIYNECFHESADETISLHFKKCNAWKALQSYKLKLFIERREMALLYGRKGYPGRGIRYFHSYESFKIKEVEILL